eukprot:10314857-Ditylum_brightwellii.AAC.1
MFTRIHTTIADTLIAPIDAVIIRGFFRALMDTFSIRIQRTIVNTLIVPDCPPWQSCSGPKKQCWDGCSVYERQGNTWKV